MAEIESGISIEDLFVEAVGILDEPASSHSRDTHHTSPKAGRTPTTNMHIAELATVIDGGNGSTYNYGIVFQLILILENM